MKKNRRWEIIGISLIWCLIATYLIVGGIKLSITSKSLIIEKLSIDIVNPTPDENEFQTSMINAHIIELLDSKGVNPMGKYAKDVDIKLIGSLVESSIYVKESDVYMGHNNSAASGEVTIEITQRNPLVRISTNQGYNFYLTKDYHILPYQNASTTYVPIVTGDISLPFGKDFLGNICNSIMDSEKKYRKNYLFISKLINFVKYIENDEFWSSQIVQINLVDSKDVAYQMPELELIPRIGSHTIFLGEVDDYRKKLDKLVVFYNNSSHWQNMQSGKTINIKYDKQVICTKLSKE